MRMFRWLNPVCIHRWNGDETVVEYKVRPDQSSPRFIEYRYRYKVDTCRLCKEKAYESPIIEGFPTGRTFSWDMVMITDRDLFVECE